MFYVGKFKFENVTQIFILTAELILAGLILAKTVNSDTVSYKATRWKLKKIKTQLYVSIIHISHHTEQSLNKGHISEQKKNIKVKGTQRGLIVFIDTVFVCIHVLRDVA